MDVRRFEEYVLGQKSVPMSNYDTDYFTKEWRDGANSYTIARRREIEGRNPALIKEVFQPKRVLDMGCGPGALMFLLNELGVSCDGIDGSVSCKQIASPEVRDRIEIAAVWAPVKPDRSYDLVISREVLEHLTVIEVREAVRNMCRISSRFIYCTTRFHPAPESLIDATTQFDVDPSHITLLNKDFLRLLFVLEGFRSRPDLEARMDWLNKGRVIVVERTPAAIAASALP
jgi:SAM-dependent methyltransferase